MSTILLNALASTAGGGVTYLRNLLPRVARIGSQHRFLALVPTENLVEYRSLAGDRIEFDTAPASGTLGRLWWEQIGLRSYLKRHDVDVLIALGNFALLGASVPQVLFSRNDLYYSEEFEHDLRARGLYFEAVSNRMKRWLSLKSIRAADLNVVPTVAFAKRLATFNGHVASDFTVIPFGFDQAAFTAKPTRPRTEQLEKLRLGSPLRRLLYVSHYNYFRNFETLIRALPHLPSDIQLVLTTDIHAGAVYGGYDATAASDLIDALGVSERIAMLGSVPYERLHHIYSACDIFVCPSYSESFGHPLVEAMASGLPVVAADLPVHREVCGAAAVYFSVFDENALAGQCRALLADKGLATRLSDAGRERSREFSWDNHIETLLALIADRLDLGRVRS